MTPDARRRAEEWETAKRLVRDVSVGSIVVMKRNGLKQGLLGRAERNAGEVIRKVPPVGLVIRRIGLKTPEHWWAGYWRRPSHG